MPLIISLNAKGVSQVAAMVEAAQARARLTRRRGPRASGFTPLPSSAPSSHEPIRPTPAQAYCLKTDENGVSLYEHLAELLQSIDLKDPNALAEFESKSLDIKAARFKPTVETYLCNPSSKKRPHAAVEMHYGIRRQHGCIGHNMTA